MLYLRDIMTTDLVTASPEMTVREAMELLSSHHVSGAPVVVGGILVGLITATDLMQFAAALSGVPTERDVQDWSDWDEPSVDGAVEQGDDPASEFFSDL